MNDFYKGYYEDHCFAHHGILGQKWGIRRYQNPDGSLTELGRERLGYSKYAGQRNDDIVLKKGTKVTRVVGNVNSADKYSDDPDFKEYISRRVKELGEEEKKYTRKYASVDNVRNSGRINGKEYYMSWFSDYGWEPDDMYVDTYQLKKDVVVASGKKVLDELIEQVGNQKLADLLNNNQTIKSLTLDYTKDKQLFEKVNDSLKKKGYDAIEDINDADSDLPVIFLDSKNQLSLKQTQLGRDAINSYLEELDKKSK